MPIREIAHERTILITRALTVTAESVTKQTAAFQVSTCRIGLRHDSTTGSESPHCCKNGELKRYRAGHRRITQIPQGLGTLTDTLAQHRTLPGPRRHGRPLRPRRAGAEPARGLYVLDSTLIPGVGCDIGGRPIDFHESPRSPDGHHRRRRRGVGRHPAPRHRHGHPTGTQPIPSRTRSTP
ncbi:MULTISPECIES: hypothetical protein [unclassified Streptomyces]|uniref:hypothetical protein n=1 Tax=unclassified Streptomyces TaxID=2593676 RepID=UPI0036E4B3CB